MERRTEIFSVTRFASKAKRVADLMERYVGLVEG
jgi:hypothetical protein